MAKKKTKKPHDQLWFDEGEKMFGLGRSLFGWDPASDPFDRTLRYRTSRYPTALIPQALTGEEIEKRTAEMHLEKIEKAALEKELKQQLDQLQPYMNAHTQHLQQQVRNQLSNIGGIYGNRAAAAQAHSGTTNATNSSSASLGTLTASEIAQLHALAGQISPGWLTFDPFADTRKPVESTGIKVGEIIGWRMWRVRKGYLYPYSQEKMWVPKEPMNGNVPDHGHEGIWAFKEKRPAIAKMTDTDGLTVYGSVKMWGQVVEHELGYRSEYAAINTLEDIHDDEGGRNWRQMLLYPCITEKDKLPELTGPKNVTKFELLKEIRERYLG